MTRARVTACQSDQAGLGFLETVWAGCELISLNVLGVRVGGQMKQDLVSSTRSEQLVSLNVVVILVGTDPLGSMCIRVQVHG